MLGIPSVLAYTGKSANPPLCNLFRECYSLYKHISYSPRIFSHSSSLRNPVTDFFLVIILRKVPIESQCKLKLAFFLQPERARSINGKCNPSSEQACSSSFFFGHSFPASNQAFHRSKGKEAKQFLEFVHRASSTLAKG